MTRIFIQKYGNEQNRLRWRDNFEKAEGESNG